MSRPPFDTTRAAFFLVAGVIALYGVVVLIGVVTCAIYSGEIAQGRFRCDGQDKLAELLAAALAAALAFAGGFNRKD
jgi:hypothetical protein